MICKSINKYQTKLFNQFDNVIFFNCCRVYGIRYKHAK